MENKIQDLLGNQPQTQKLSPSHVEQAALLAEYSTLYDKLLSEKGILQNAYFETLRNGHMTLSHFVQTQISHQPLFEALPRAALTLLTRMDATNETGRIFKCLTSEHDQTKAFQSFIEGINDPSLQLRKNPTDQKADIPHCIKTCMHCIGASTHFDDLIFATAFVKALYRTYAISFGHIRTALIERGWWSGHDIPYFTEQKTENFELIAAYLLETLAQHTQSDMTKNPVKDGYEFALYNYDRLHRDLVDI